MSDSPSCSPHLSLPYFGTKISARHMVIIAAAIWCGSDFIGQLKVWNLHILLDPTVLLPPHTEKTKEGLAARLPTLWPY